MYQTPFDPLPQLKRAQRRFFWSRWLGSILMSIFFFGGLFGGIGLMFAGLLSSIIGIILWKHSMSEFEKQKQIN